MNTLLTQASQSHNRQELEISIASAIYAMTRAQFVRIHTLLSVAGEKLSVISSQVDATGVYSIADTSQGVDWTAGAALLGDHPLMSRVVSDQASIRQQEESTGLHHCFYPITLHGEVRGIVELKENHRPYQDEDALISGFIALYINYAHFLDGSSHDPLTSLLKEEHLVPCLEQVLATAKQAISENSVLASEVSGAGYCLAIVAIDHFKEINKVYGHLFGDEIRRRVAHELTAWCPQEAKLFFTSADEFVVLVPAVAARLVETSFSQFLEHMSRQDVPSIGQLTLSVGLSQIFLPDNPQEVLERSRLALSKAQSLNTKIIRRPGAR